MPEPDQPELEKDNPISVTQPGEEFVCEIKRHPIGIIGIHLALAAALIAVAVLLIAVMPSFFSESSRSQLVFAGGLVFLIIATICLVILFIANKIYWGNRWIVTNDSITQIIQRSLFDTQSSQLSLGDLEDITVEQDGLLAQTFKYGVISAETAAAEDKFKFIYCPDPNNYAKQILAAREQFEERIYHLTHDQTPAPNQTITQPTTDDRQV